MRRKSDEGKEREGESDDGDRDAETEAQDCCGLLWFGIDVEMCEDRDDIAGDADRGRSGELKYELRGRRGGRESCQN